MARRKQSTAEDIIEVTSKFPWWVGFLLAAISYLWLHSIASRGVPQAPAGDMAQSMKGSLIYAFASLAQYFLPFLLGFGGLISLFMSLKRKKIHGDVSTGARQMSDISWQDFELLISQHFRTQGFSVKETSPGPDGGVDLVLNKDAAKYLVQCKHYKAYKVGVKPVRELLGVMASKGAAGGYVITSGQFTRDAVGFAKSNRIQLIDGSMLQNILRATPRSDYRGKPSTPKRATTVTAESNSQQNETNSCQKCGAPMVERVAKKGNRAGQKFWGCSRYPNCRNTAPIE